MPRISEFFGIVISMRFDDHQPPHFHAKYSEFEISIAIKNLKVLKGRLPRRRLGKVLRWAALHRKELLADWDLASRHMPLNEIDPLA